MITLRLLTILSAIDETGSLSGAAKRLGLTQSAISQAVLSFEEALGQRIFDRTLRPPVFTLAGRLILQHAAGILSRAQQLEHALRFSSQAQLPLLRLGMLDTFAATVGPRLMEDVRDIAASWSIVSGARETGLATLLEHRADLLITSEDTSGHPGLATMPIMSEPYFLVLPKGETEPFEDLGELAGRLDFVRYGPGMHITGTIEHYLQEQGVVPPKKYQLDTVDAAMAMVAGGLGWGITTPLALLKAQNRIKDLRCLPLPASRMSRTISLVTHAGGSEAIAGQIRTSAIRVLKAATLPQIAKLLPDFVSLVTVEAAE